MDIALNLSNHWVEYLKADGTYDSSEPIRGHFNLADGVTGVTVGALTDDSSILAPVVSGNTIIVPVSDGDQWVDVTLSITGPTAQSVTHRVYPRQQIKPSELLAHITASTPATVTLSAADITNIVSQLGTEGLVKIADTSTSGC